MQVLIMNSNLNFSMVPKKIPHVIKRGNVKLATAVHALSPSQ